MNLKAKKLTTGVLALTAVAIWLPQLTMGVVQKSPQPRSEFDSFESADSADESFPETADGFDEFADPGFEESESFNESNEMLSTGSLAEQLEQTTERLRAFGGNQRVDLDQLLQSLGTHSSGVNTNVTTNSSAQAVPVNGRESLAHQLANDALLEFARGQTLSAIIHRQSDPLAMMNGLLVRVGDELGDGIFVAEIEPRRVRIASGEHSRWLMLTSFRTRIASEDGELQADSLETTAPSPGNELRFVTNDAAPTTQPEIAPQPTGAEPVSGEEQNR